MMIKQWSLKRLRFALAAFACAFAFVAKAELPAPKPGCSQGAYTTYVRITYASVYGAIGYAVYRSANTDFGAADPVGVSTSTEYRDYSVKPGAKYYYWVCPVDENGDAWFNVSRYARGYAKSPTVDTPKATDGTVAAYTKISWKAVSGATKYILYVSASKYVADANLYDCETSLSISHKGTPGKKYYYWVGAVVNGYVFRSKKYDVGWRKKVLTIYTPKYVLIFQGESQGTGWWYARFSGDLIAPSKASHSCSVKGCAIIHNFGGLDDDGFCGDITGRKSGKAYITIKYSNLSVKSKAISIIKYGYSSASAS